MDGIKNISLSESGEDPKHIKERVELVDTPVRDEVTEENDSSRNESTAKRAKEEMLMQECISNYIIVRAIMNHLDWREQLRCRLMCRLWRDAVQSVQLENLHSYDFLVKMGAWKSKHPIKLHVSDLPVRAMPMLAVIFCEMPDLPFLCAEYSPAPCDPPCPYKHEITDVVHAIMLSNISRLLAVDVCRLIFMPPPTSPTFHHTMHNVHEPSTSVLGGLYLPRIPNVNYNNIKYRTHRTVHVDVYRVVDDICATDFVKGVIVFVNNPLCALDDAIVNFLSYFKYKQPGIPYAVGGCLTKLDEDNVDAMNEKDWTFTIGVFSVPKELDSGQRCRFDMYSLIIDSTVIKKSVIQTVIQDFAEKIPERQFSAGLMLSDLRRQRFYPVEQDLFRTSFPRTTLVGCYGGRIKGCNHPDTRPQPTYNCEQEFKHSDSTVLVYFSWGKECTRGETHHTNQ